MCCSNGSEWSEDCDQGQCGVSGVAVLVVMKTSTKSMVRAWGEMGEGQKRKRAKIRFGQKGHIQQHLFYSTLKESRLEHLHNVEI